MTNPDPYTVKFVRKFADPRNTSHLSELISKWGDNYLLNPVFVVILRVGPPWYEREEAFALSTCDHYKTNTAWVNIVDIYDKDTQGYLVRGVMASAGKDGMSHSNNKIIQFLDERYKDYYPEYS